MAEPDLPGTQGSPPSDTTLEGPLGRWFDRLVRARMALPAIGLVPTSVGMTVLIGSALAPDAYMRWIEGIGFGLLVLGAILFALGIVVVFIRAWRGTWAE